MSQILTLFGVLMAILIPVCMFIFFMQYVQNKKLTKSEIKKLRAELSANSNDDLEKEIAELKERIVVLESIVTDRGFEVERKISNL